MQLTELEKRVLIGVMTKLDLSYKVHTSKPCAKTSRQQRRKWDAQEMSKTLGGNFLNFIKL